MQNQNKYSQRKLTISKYQEQDYKFFKTGQFTR